MPSAIPTPSATHASMSDLTPEPSDDTDRLLLSRLRGGEHDAASELYVKYAERLIRVAKRQTATNLASRFDPEDVVQSVFRTFFRRFSTGAYNLPDGDELWKLLLVISLNKLRKLGGHHRAQKRDARRTQGGEQISEVPQDGSEEALLHLRMTIDELLSQLEPSAARIIRLRMEGREVNEIATLTDRSKRTVERVLQNFRQRLGQEVEEIPGIGEDSDHA